MDESDITQPMPAAGEHADEVLDAPEAQVVRERARIPRRWFAVAVIAVLLLAAGVGIYLGMRGQDEPDGTKVAEVEQATVPDLRGMTLERAIADAEAAGLEIGTTAMAVVDPSVSAAGTVLSQEPLPGTKVVPGSAITLVLAEAPAAPPAADAGGTSGTQSGNTEPAATPPPPPDDVSIVDLGQMVVAPKAIDITIFQVQQWTTVLEHTGSSAEWTSGAVALGAGDKRVVLSGDGPSGYLVAVWSWDAAVDTDWKLESVVVSAPGGATFETALSAPAGTTTFMVKSQNTSVLWTVQVQEKK